jgi:hypothetical protein
MRSLALFDPAFVADSDRCTVLGAAVDAAVVLSGADMGNVQVWNRRAAYSRSRRSAALRRRSGSSSTVYDTEKRMWSGVHAGRARRRRRRRGERDLP